MSVPATGDFSMFGYFNNTTIQGAIAQGGGSVNGDTEFEELIDASTTSRFHPASNIINGNPTAITNLNQVDNALQYRRYPTFTISLCHDPTDSDGACDCDHGSATYYVFGDSTSSSNEVTQFAQAHTITNADGTTPDSGFYSNGGIYRFWNNDVGAFGDGTGITAENPNDYNFSNNDCGDRAIISY
jgi:hypothetical protein